MAAAFEKLKKKLQFRSLDTAQKLNQNRRSMPKSGHFYQIAPYKINLDRY